MTSWKAALFVGAVLTVAAGQTASCAEQTVGGRTVTQEFSDPHVAALVRTACEGDLLGVERALTEGADPNFRGFEGITPLFWVVKCENAGGIEALLQAGADPNYKPPGRFSPTYAAATMWNPEPLGLLLRHGGDPNARNGDDIDGDSALWEALQLGWGGHGWNNYYALLQSGADINRANSAGKTIAHQAVTLAEFEKVSELLDRGYDGDLVSLGRAVTVRDIDSASFPAAAAARSRLIRKLEQRGVTFPVLP